MKVPDTFNPTVEMYPHLGRVTGRNDPIDTPNAKAAVRAFLEAELNDQPFPKLKLTLAEYEYVCRCFDGYRRRDALERLRQPTQPGKDEVPL